MFRPIAVETKVWGYNGVVEKTLNMMLFVYCMRLECTDMNIIFIYSDIKKHMVPTLLMTPVNLHAGQHGS